MWSKFGAHGEHGDVFVFSNTLIYGISRDGSKTFNIRTCEHMILGQLRMGARQAKNAPLSRADLLIVTCAGDPWSSNRRGEARRRLGQHHGLQP